MGAPRTFGGLVAAPGKTARGGSAKHYQTPRIVETPVVIDGNMIRAGFQMGMGYRPRARIPKLSAINVFHRRDNACLADNARQRSETVLSYHFPQVLSVEPEHKDAMLLPVVG